MANSRDHNNFNKSWYESEAKIEVYDEGNDNYILVFKNGLAFKILLIEQVE